MKTEKEIWQSLFEMERLEKKALALIKKGHLLKSETIITYAQNWHISTGARANILKWVLGIDNFSEQDITALHKELAAQGSDTTKTE